MLLIQKIILAITIFTSVAFSLKAEAIEIGDRVFLPSLAYQRGGTIVGFTKNDQVLVKWDSPQYGIQTLEKNELLSYLQIGALAKVKYSYNRFINTIYSYGKDIIYINTVGRIEEITGNWVTIRELSGKLIQVPKYAITRVTFKKAILCVKIYSH